MTTLSKECSSPRTNSSSSIGSSGRGGASASHAASCAGSSMRNVLRAPAPASGLATNGKPTRWANSSASAVEATWPLRAHGTPAASNAAFMRALSRKRSATSAVIPSIPNRSRTWASGTWRFSRMATKRSTDPRWRPIVATASVSWSASRQSSIRQ